MSLSRLPLSYCTNVHPGRSVAEVESGLDRYTSKIHDSFGSPLAAGLWLAEPVVTELLATPDALSRFAGKLAGGGLTCHTLNAFPYGDFHSERVKEKVYLPDWSDPRRLHYTMQCAEVLARLLPANVDGSISTVPLGFKGFPHPADFHARCGEQLVKCARQLKDLHEKSGKRIRLAIEPEPLCELETTGEAIAFFQSLWKWAETGEALESVREYLGVCFDVCHQAVEFEDVANSIVSLDRAGVRINKVHISCALQLDRPAENAAGRDALRRYIEPRYLHQTLARTGEGIVRRFVDLNEELIARPPADFAGAPAWRVHFHVPVDADTLGPLSTTRPALSDALRAVAKLHYAPHLEVETYTWEVMPGGGPTNLVQGLTRELIATDRLIAGTVQA